MCGERKDNCVLYEKDRHVARITLNKPEKRNALMKSSPGALRGASESEG